MVHTLPDGTTKYKMVTIFGQIDSGELAARLGSIASFDRRGNVIWMDDFESSILHWGVTAGGGGGAAAYSTDRALRGNGSCKIQSGTTTEDPTEIIRPLAFPVLGKMGFELAISYAALINILTWRMVVYDGSTIYTAKVFWHNGLNRFYYHDHNDDPQVLRSGVDLTQPDHGFNIIKLVCDFSTGEYIRLIYNATTIPMTDLKFYQNSSGVSPRMLIEFWVDGVTDQDAVVYVDNAIVTQNEP